MAVEPNPGPPKGKVKKAAKQEAKKEAKREVKREVEKIAAVSKVGKDLPKASNHFARLSGSKSMSRSRRRFRGRRGGKETLDVVGQALMDTVTLSSPTQGGIVVEIPINPHKLRAAALNIWAQLWEFDTIENVTFHVPPAAATTDASQLVHYVDLDPTDRVPSGGAALVDHALNHKGVMFATREGGVLRAPRLKTVGRKYIDSTDGSPSDQRLTTSGTYRLVVQVGASSSATISVWCTYHVRFKERSLDMETAAVGPMLSIDNTTDADLKVGDPFGWTGSGATLPLSGATSLGVPVQVVYDTTHTHFLIFKNDLGYRPNYLIMTGYTQQTDCKGAFTITPSGSTFAVNTIMDAPAATSMTSRCTQWLIVFGQAEAGSITSAGGAVWYRNNAIERTSYVRQPTSADPAWNFTILVASVSTPTYARTLFTMHRVSAVPDYYAGNATLEGQALAEFGEKERKETFEAFLARYRKQRDPQTVEQLLKELERYKALKIATEEPESPVLVKPTPPPSRAEAKRR